MTPIQRVQEAIEEIKKGKMVIMMDDEDRENEGDLVYAAAFSTPEHVNFMAKEARGLICVALTQEIAQRLDLQPMVSSNTSMHETAFTISVDAKDAKTGISAYERDMTIKILANPISKPDELVKPGHIFPLIAKEGGVLVRTGHTEGSVDLCTLAGVAPSAVICEIIKDDGEMARRDDLVEFAKEHDMKIVYISDLVEYRLANEKLLSLKSSEEIEFFDTTVEKKVFEDHQGIEHTALVFGSIAKHTAVKVHNVIPDIELLLNQTKYKSMINAIEYFKEHNGVLVFINKPKHHDDSTTKEFGIGAQILKELGIEKMDLLTSTPKADFVGLSGFGLEIAQTITL